MFNHNIPNIDVYNSAMRKGMMDKIHCLDKVDSEVIVDIGCADGSTIELMYLIFPDKIYVGFDINQAEIELARVKCPYANFFSDWGDLETFLRSLNKTVTGICNSLIHEVYAYGSKADVELFWKRLFSDVFTYIAIRDMMSSETSTRPSDVIAVTKIRMRYNQERLREFETRWGSITENWSMMHFLLKYRYVDNWEREVDENYLPITTEAFMRLIPNEWTPVYVEHFTHHFTRQEIKKDFDIDLVDRTHFKVVLQRK